jgi:hypothetical protein
MALAMEQLGISGRVLGIDTFEGHTVVDGELDGTHTVGDLSTSKADVLGYLKDLGNVEIQEGDVMKLGAILDNLSEIGLLHIDVDVYAPTKFCLDHFGTKMWSRGSIVVDDYGFTTCPGAKRAVDEFCQTAPQYCPFHLLTGQAILIRQS